MAAGETILYYHPDEQSSLGKMAGVLFRMKVRIRRVRSEDFGETIGGLAGLKSFTPPEVEGRAELPEKAEISEEVMVLSGFSDSRLNELLAQLRKAGVPSVSLKAAVTATNRSWTFFQLYQELGRERAAYEQKTQTDETDD